MVILTVLAVTPTVPTTASSFSGLTSSLMTTWNRGFWESTTALLCLRTAPQMSLGREALSNDIIELIYLNGLRSEEKCGRASPGGSRVSFARSEGELCTAPDSLP